jgi:hypothetical protein
MGYYNCQKHSKQNQQCTYNVILRRFRAAIVILENQYVLHTVSVGHAAGGVFG